MALTYKIQADTSRLVGGILDYDLRNFMLDKTDFILDDGVNVITSYRFKTNNQTVRMFPFAAFNGTAQILEESLLNGDIWLKFVSSITPNLSLAVSEKTTREIVVGTTTVTGRFKFEGTWITDATWTAASGVLAWQARPDTTVKWSTFNQWINFLKDFLSAIKNYSM